MREVTIFICGIAVGQKILFCRYGAAQLDSAAIYDEYWPKVIAEKPFIKKLQDTLQLQHIQEKNGRKRVALRSVQKWHHREERFPFTFDILDLSPECPPVYQWASLPDGGAIYLFPLLVNAQAPHKIIPLITPLILSCGTYTLLLEDFSSASTVKDLRDFLKKNPEIYRNAQEEIKKYHLTRCLLGLDGDEVEFVLFDPLNQHVLTEQEDKRRLGCGRIALAPKRASQTPSACIFLPSSRWYNPCITSIKAVCLLYLGYEIPTPEGGDWTVLQVVEYYAHLPLTGLEEIKIIQHRQKLATGIAYYCLDTRQTQLLNAYSGILRYVPFSIEFEPIHFQAFTAENNTAPARIPAPPSIDSIIGRIQGAHSSKQKWSFFRSKKHDPFLKQLESDMKALALHEHKREVDVGRGEVSNLLLCRLQEESKKKKWDPSGRTSKAMAAALCEVKQLPKRLAFSQYYTTFFMGAARPSVKKILVKHLPSVLAQIILTYRGHSYLELCYSIPLPILNQLTAFYPDAEFNNHIITQSCVRILEELGITPEVALGVCVGPDKIDAPWSLTQALGSSLEEKRRAIKYKYLFFALPVHGRDGIGHAVGVVMDMSKKRIYCIDPQANAYHAQDEALKQLEALVSNKGSLFFGFQILSPRTGVLRQQPAGSLLCGAYFVSNVVGLITQWEGTNISSRVLGIEPHRLLHNAQIDLDHWTQPGRIDIDTWKALIILTTLDQEQLETSFLKTVVENHNKVMSCFL